MPKDKIELTMAEVDSLFHAMTLAREALNCITVVQMKAYNLSPNTAEMLDAAAEKISQKFVDPTEGITPELLQIILAKHGSPQRTSRNKKGLGGVDIADKI